MTSLRVVLMTTFASAVARIDGQVQYRGSPTVSRQRRQSRWGARNLQGPQFERAARAGIVRLDRHATTGIFPVVVPNPVLCSGMPIPRSISVRDTAWLQRHLLAE